jgi:hypothetical protein
MGRGAGRYFVGTDIYYPTLLGMTAAARELVAEDPNKMTLPQDSIAILMHQGYQFMFVRASDGDDPPVYHYMELSGKFEAVADSLSGYLLDAAHDEW